MISRVFVIPGGMRGWHGYQLLPWLSCVASGF